MTGAAPRPEAVDAAWLTAALRRAGVLRDASVVEVASRKVGEGMLGDSVRYALTYDREEPGAPASLVGKFACADPVSRATGADYGLYLKEVRFYQEIADAVAIRTPRAYVAEIDEATSDFVLLLEDLTPARQGNQLTGCSLADAEMVIDQAAALHGPLWGDPSLAERAWLTGGADMTAHAAAFPEFLRMFRERYDDMLEPEIMRVCADAVALVERYYALPDRPPPTVQHLDFRLDNMLFEPRGGVDPLAVLDWQSVTAGPGVLDVAYFIGAGLPAEVRREHERALLDRWLEGLARFGVTGYDRDRAWRDYRLHVLQGLYTAVFASVATKRTERGDDMFLTMARRHAAQAVDLDTLGLLARTA
jgi:hypothetical protein